MRESFTPQNQASAAKYEKYLVLFTKLLCKLQKGNVEKWVTKSYFPPDKCLPICKEYANLRGEAILTMRSGKHLDAIDVYMKVLSTYPIYKMLAQFKLLRKDRPSFLGYQEQDDEDTRLVGRNLGPGAKNPSRFVPDSIQDFDEILGKACNICQVNDLDEEQRMKAWFQILHYLQDFISESSLKVTDSLTNAKKEFRDLDLVNLREDDKMTYTIRLKDFVSERINYILRFPGLDISTKMIVKQLNLSFDQLKSLCNSKLKHNSTTLQIENCSNLIAVDQLYDLFSDVTERLVSLHSTYSEF